MSKQPVLTDSERLDHLERSGGFVVGTADGLPAYRLLGTDDWYNSLRGAVDAYATLSSCKGRNPEAM